MRINVKAFLATLAIILIFGFVIKRSCVRHDPAQEERAEELRKDAKRIQAESKAEGVANEVVARKQWGRPSSGDGGVREEVKPPTQGEFITRLPGRYGEGKTLSLTFNIAADSVEELASAISVMEGVLDALKEQGVSGTVFVRVPDKVGPMLKALLFRIRNEGHDVGLLAHDPKGFAGYAKTGTLGDQLFQASGVDGAQDAAAVVLEYDPPIFRPPADIVFNDAPGQLGGFAERGVKVVGCTLDVSADSADDIVKKWRADFKAGNIYCLDIKSDGDLATPREAVERIIALVKRFNQSKVAAPAEQFHFVRLSEPLGLPPPTKKGGERIEAPTPFPLDENGSAPASSPPATPPAATAPVAPSDGGLTPEEAKRQKLQLQLEYLDSLTKGVEPAKP